MFIAVGGCCYGNAVRFSLQYVEVVYGDHGSSNKATKTSVTRSVCFLLLYYVCRNITGSCFYFKCLFTSLSPSTNSRDRLMSCVMERYESLGPVGEGSYGTVLKCRHRESGRLVAIKKFVDSDDDRTVKKIALREIKLLRVAVSQSFSELESEAVTSRLRFSLPSSKHLRHDNLVNLMEVWRRRRRWYLVFEFVERTLLDDLEKTPSGLELNTSRLYLYQILRAAAFCHQQHVRESTAGSERCGPD